ncbi:MAG: transcription antitermination factor NusB [Burkholderiaceae bacterium]
MIVAADDPSFSGEADEGSRSGSARAAGGRAGGGRNARRRSREFALQGLYQWLVAQADLGVILAGLVEAPGYRKCDQAHLEGILGGVVRGREALEAMLTPHVDRPLAQVSPIERAILLIGAHELRAYPEIPYRVVINEAIDLAKAYGGTDGFKFVNGVLDRVAADCGVAQGRR